MKSFALSLAFINEVQRNSETAYFHFIPKIPVLVLIFRVEALLINVVVNLTVFGNITREFCEQNFNILEGHCPFRNSAFIKR